MKVVMAKKQHQIANSSIQRGFTLMELMIVVAIVAILAAISIPAYQQYIIKSEIRAAQSDLLSLSMQFENSYQRNLAYPAVTVDDAGAITTQFSGKWSASSTANFTFTASASSASAYTLVATGANRQSGCTITLTHLNARTNNGGCKYTGSDWL